MKVDVLIVMELEVDDGGVIQKSGGTLCGRMVEQWKLTLEVTADCQYSFKRI